VRVPIDMYCTPYLTVPWQSTLLKQMKLRFQSYTPPERDAYKEIIFSNIVQSMSAILTALSALGLALASVHNARQNIILTHPAVDADALPLAITEAIRYLWSDPTIQEAVRRSKEFQLLDNAAYYFDAIDRISAVNYQPTTEDILRSSASTTGIWMTSLTIGFLTVNVFDVGGSRSERRKWINCFDNVDVVIFLVGLSEYDQVLWEDDSVNRMEEALTLFGSISKSRWFAKTSMILFMNKIDLFVKKLQHSPLSDSFDDFEWGSDYEAACEYLLHRFVQLHLNPTRQLYAHFICATDTEVVKHPLDVVMSVLDSAHLLECNFL